MTSQVIDGGRGAVHDGVEPADGRWGGRTRCMEGVMTEVDQVIDRYFEIWNETDARRRRELIGRTWTEDASYVDPLMSGDGPDGIDAMVGGVQERFPGHWFRRTGGIDAYQDRVRFSWELIDGGGGAPLVAGVDFGVVAADGRLREITGFLDQGPVVPGGA